MLSIPLGKTAIKVMNLRCPMHPICKGILKNYSDLSAWVSRFLFGLKSCFSLVVRKERELSTKPRM